MTHLQDLLKSEVFNSLRKQLDLNIMFRRKQLASNGVGSSLDDLVSINSQSSYIAGMEFANDFLDNQVRDLKLELTDLMNQIESYREMEEDDG